MSSNASPLTHSISFRDLQHKQLLNVYEIQGISELLPMKYISGETRHFNIKICASQAGDSIDPKQT